MQPNHKFLAEETISSIHACMDTQFTQGESSTFSHLSYDVFLSFRGEDTRKNFTGHLYTRLCQVGIHTFIDDEELRKGHVISKELEKSIEKSRVSIVIFSKNYASSSWCLEELVKILECKNKLNQVVLPIFYDVNPSQVRKQTGWFGEGFAKLEERFEVQRIDRWKGALVEAADLSGWDLQNVADGHESKFIEYIIEQVLQEVNQTPLDVACYPIGVDSRVEEIELLLRRRYQREVQIIGIHGTGGIGKTTLAKAVYNRIHRYFESSCFLFDVRSEAKARKGLVKLQEELLCQLLKKKDVKVNSVDEGIKLIESRLCSKRVLVVLDNLDKLSQLQSLARDCSWFGSGSLIIITTRDEQLLFGLREDDRYEAKLLNDSEAQQLLSCHSFNSLFPPQEYVEFAQAIIKYSGGLPLALVTLGSHLQGMSVEEWRYELKKLRAFPHCEIQQILKISFDELDDDTQSVFLDIACAFSGFSPKEVAKTLKACGFHSKSAIATLVRKHLLQRNKHCLVMHDLVRDMGREIVRMESPREPGKRSRLFNPEEVRDVIQGRKGSKKVQVLKIDRRAIKGTKVSTKAFKKMENLRVLMMDGLHIRGDFNLLSEELRWLTWQNCPLKCIPSHFPAEKLVVLDMQGSDIEDFGLNLQYCRSLKKLDLSDCKRLRKCPNFKGSRSLKTLRFKNCTRLMEIHPSIGNLDRLTDLHLPGCKNLKNLPSSISQLKSLKTLNVRWCSSLQTLPSLSILENLVVLWLSNCKKLSKITEMNNLPSIEHIFAFNCTSLGNPFNEGFFHAPAIACPSRLWMHRAVIMFLQCGEIPDWCSYHVSASSTCFTMPTHKEYKFLGMLVWFVFKVVEDDHSGQGMSILIGEARRTFNWDYNFVMSQRRWRTLMCTLLH